MSTYIKFENIDGPADFQMKLNMRESIEQKVEFSCGCSFKVNADETAYWAHFCFWMHRLYEGRNIEEEQSLWSDPHFARTPHAFCSQDEEQIRRVDELVEKRRDFLNSTSRYATSSSKSKMADLELKEIYMFLLTKNQPSNYTLSWPLFLRFLVLHLFRCIIYVFVFILSLLFSILFMFLLFLCAIILSMLVPTSNVSMTEGKYSSGLPSSVKRHLQQEHEEAMATTCNEQLVKNTSNQKKINKKMHKKKPNQGKAPNNIRKTKKPARL
ncbi:Oidioi.mRNA.OKI2018_I69.chr2.g8309.t1.cds [Oikopleura dioica]|uniref:Oidioi.mRNA.OKI2018_I69.chr2.g8309.t1.cds n=1 Tax=Oikopleura dioica TaxID=34765 RepID=A0ABN7TF95_OIKDI|nr:Oidioi.mRNA.OKI2018_I69.chr2.g8309.t1.cds [Oikopleura dioica]